MLVSVITPSYNQGRFLERTMLSVLEQDYPHIEYIVVDGGSDDNSVEIIKRYADRLAWWVSEKDRGQTDAINKGFERANGQILAWLNSDDTYRPGAISQAVAYMQEHPEVGLIYGDANYIDEHDHIIGQFPSKQTSYRLLRWGHVHIPQQASFFRADLWHKVGPLDPSFYFAMDYDLWVRLAAEAPLVHLPLLWANFRLHGDAKSIAEDDRCWPEMLKVHYRDGGNWFSPLLGRYMLRRMAAPLIRWRRRRLFEANTNPRYKL